MRGKYIGMLKAGGTKHHFELLKPLGLSVIPGMIGEQDAM